MQKDLEINLFEIWSALYRKKVFIVLFIFVATVSGIIYALAQTRFYASQITLMPLSSGNSSGGGSRAVALVSKLGGGGGLLQGFSSSIDEISKMMAVVKSKTLNKKVVEEMNLLPLLYKEQWDPAQNKWKTDHPPEIADAAVRMQGLVFLEKDTDTSILKLTIEFTDPITAAKIANYYPTALQDYLNQNDLTLQKRHRKFMEAQLELNKKKLLETSKEIAKYYSSAQISSREAVVDVPINYSPLLMAQNEEGLDKTQKVLDEQIQSFQEQAADIDRKLSVKDVPAHVYLDYLTEYRKILRELQLLLANQHEMAKIEESRENLSFQVIDRAELEPIPVRPSRKLIVTLAFLASLAFSVIAVLLVDYFKKMKSEFASFKNSS